LKETEVPRKYSVIRDRLVSALIQVGAIDIAATELRNLFNFRTPLKEAGEKRKVGPITNEIVEDAAWLMAFVPLAKKLKHEAVLGVPREGEPYAQECARKTGKLLVQMDMWQVGDKRCITGVRGQVPGDVTDVIVFDGVSLTGESLRHTVRNLREPGTEIGVQHAVVLLDFEHGARELLQEEGVTLHAVYTATELLEKHPEAEKVLPYIRTSIGWKAAYSTA